MMKQFWNDETGFIVSAELVLVATILVIGLVVGLAEVQSAVAQELKDVGQAIGSLNQSFFYTGFASFKSLCGNRGVGGRFKAFTTGSAFFDRADECDRNDCALGCAAPTAEFPNCAASGGGPSFQGGTCGGTWGGATCNPSYSPHCADSGQCGVPVP